MRRLARPLPDAERVELTQGWSLARGPNPTDADWRPLPAPLPLAAALQAWGEPLPQAGERDLDAEHWTWRLRFDAPAGEGHWLLGLDGVATCARVALDGQPLLASDNMFRSHELDLSGRLAPGPHELTISALPLAAALARRRPRPRWRTPMLNQQQLRWWRTSLLGRTPGWSPPWPAIGPWRPVWLEPHSPARPVHLALDARLVDGEGRLAVTLGLAAGAAAARAVRLHLRRGEQGFEQALAPDADGLWQGTLAVPRVQPWWPHTHGEPALYDAELLIDEAGGGTRRLALGGVGFRTLALDTADGGFALRVNGLPVFARGACWMPLDMLRLHATPAAYDAALAPLRAAGINMLRLPGCAVYEDDAFFDACDRHGVLVWQDLMFANMDYPADDEGFAAEVRAELAQQLPRWQARPSLALVCGNSEVSQQAAMWGAERVQWAPPLFHEHLPAQVAAALPGVPYWPSSAWGGALPFQPDVGSTSYYGVGAYRRALDDARHSRLKFASECLGFANIPDDAGLARLRALNHERAVPVHSAAWKARSPRDLGAGWDFDDVRDHYVERLYGLRADELRAHDAARHLMLGRAAVAEAMRASFDQWRAAGSACGGALVWFLRDLWTGAGWGVLDELGQPKSAFHGLASAWQPVHLGLVDEGLSGLVVQLDNEGAEALDGSLRVAWLRDGATVVAEGGQALRVEARSRLALPVHGLLDGFVDGNWSYRFGPPVADVLWVRWLDAAGGLRAERLWFPAGLRSLDLGLRARTEALPDGRRRVLVNSRAAARGLHVQTEGWRAEREFFDLPPGEDRSLLLRPVQPGAPWRVMLQAVNGTAAVVVPEGGA